MNEPSAAASDVADSISFGARRADLVDERFFAHAFGESLPQTLDLTTWRPGDDLAQIYGELDRQIQEALAIETALSREIRTRIFPTIESHPGGAADAGVYQARIADIERVHRDLLFCGQVEACNGTAVTHDTLATTITQIGVCLVTYRGDTGNWVHRMYRRDLRERIVDSVETAADFLENRQFRDGDTINDQNRLLSTISRRGILAYAERAALVERSTAPWRMGHGVPVPFELLSGSGSMQLLDASLTLLARLIDQPPRFVFVPSQPPERGVLTIGHALRPLEYLVVDVMTKRMRDLVKRSHYRTAADRRRAQEFAETYGPKLVMGLYRATASAPPQFFYAHADHVHEAAMIALADSTLQEHRGFPTLLDLADTVCRSTFKPGDFLDSVRLAYLESGRPFGFATNSETRG